MPLVWTEQDEQDYQKKRKEYLDQPLQETTEEQYEEQFGMLPPLVYRSSTEGSTSFFLVSEMTFDDITAEYYCLNEKEYYFKYVSARDKSTWISLKDIYNYKAQKKLHGG